MTNKNVKVFIACHKKCDVPSDSMYLPLHVGAEGKEDIGFTKDNSGENISAKNPVFCELTGLYWAWKNLSCDYLGLSHYRRYFTLKSKSVQKKEGDLASVLTLEEADTLLSKYKVLVPKKRKYYIESVYSHYSHTFDGGQLDAARKILEQKYPAYLADFDQVMNGTSAYIFNMYIMDKTLSDAYCEWLFDILFDLEKQIDTSNMTAFEARYAGRVSERLFNVWLKHQVREGKLKASDIHEIPYLYMGKVDWYRKITSFLAAKLFHKKYDKSF